MAIIIPSKRTYNRQNPKVRDNVIERIEVGAIEPIIETNYNANVFSLSEDTLDLFDYPKIGDNFGVDVDVTEFIGEKAFSSYGYYNSVFKAWYFYFAFCSSKPFYKTLNIEIPKVSLNKYIENLNDTKFNYSVYYGYVEDNSFKIILNKTANADNKDDYYNNQRYTFSSALSEEFSLTYDEQSSDLSKIKNVSNEEIFEFGEEDIIAKVNLTNEENLDTATITYNKEKDAYTATVKILCGIVKGNVQGSRDLENLPQTITEYGTLHCYVPLKVTLDLNGKSLTLNLTDKTVYIPETDKTSKKVYSVDGNELMQTTNYFRGTKQENAIESMYGKTRKEYANGKETATILCSVNDYFDYDTKEKVVAIDNSTNKMSFTIGDEVIPMVYGTDGKDNPMSVYSTGNPKIFEVIGTKLYYDGAVWQELSLLEKKNLQSVIKDIDDFFLIQMNPFSLLKFNNKIINI